MKLNSYQEVPAELQARWSGAGAEDEDEEDGDGLSVCQGRAPVEFLRDAATHTRAVRAPTERECVCSCEGVRVRAP